MTKVTIRVATLNDVAAITAVHQSTIETWREPKTRHPIPYESLDLFGRWYNGGAWMSPELCAVHLNNLLLNGHLPLVAEIDGVIVGEAEYYHTHEPAPFGPGLHLSILYVHQEWQKYGVGRDLLEAGIQHARTIGVSQLTTNPESEALDFYKKMDFTPWRSSREMQITAKLAPQPATRPLQQLTQNPGQPQDLAQRIGRYQCGAQGWDALWPGIALPGWVDLKRKVWRGKLGEIPVVLGLREQMMDPNQCDGYAWMPTEAALAPAVAALRTLAAKEGFSALDILVAENSLPELKEQFRLDYQTTVDLWHRSL